MHALKLLFLVLTFGFVGCGGSGSGGDPYRPAAAAVPATVTVTLPPVLAVEAAPNVDPGCQPAVAVELSQAGGELNGALLTDTLVGGCERLVRPNRRFYALTYVGTECGSRIYRGLLADGKGASTLTVLDHRERRCNDGLGRGFELRERGAAERHYLSP